MPHRSSQHQPTASMHKHHHCCKCPECYEVTRMAALRRMDAPAYGGEWQAEPYGYPPGYGGGQTLPPPASGGGGSMGGGGGTLGRSKGKNMSGGGPGGPNPKGQSKGGPKVNGNNSSGQGGWWPECTCTNREWYDQVTLLPHCFRQPRHVGPVGGGGAWEQMSFVSQSLIKYQLCLLMDWSSYLAFISSPPFPMC